MPQHDPYEDESQNAGTFTIFNEEPEAILEQGVLFLNTEILLLRGDKMARSQVVCQKCDVDGNSIDRSNQSPILDMHLYEVKFPGEEITELAANIVTDLMYAQCVDRNE